MPVYKLIYSIIQCIYIDVMKCGLTDQRMGPAEVVKEVLVDLKTNK